MDVTRKIIAWIAAGALVGSASYYAVREYRKRRANGAA